MLWLMLFAMHCIASRSHCRQRSADKCFSCVLQGSRHILWLLFHRILKECLDLRQGVCKAYHI